MTTQTLPIDLYYAATPNGRKITIMLEELELPYAIYPINIGRGDQFKPDFLAISPNNKIPAIVDPEGPEGQPVSIFESGAILKYLAEKFGRFYGTNWSERIKIDEWLFWQVGGFGPMLGQNNHFSRYAPEKIPYAIKRYQDESHRLYRVLDTQLGKQADLGQSYVAGDYSIADIAIFDWSRGSDNHGIDIAEFPAFAAWRQRVTERPAVQRALGITLDQSQQISAASDKEAQRILFNQR
ncbi:MULTISPECIES: glutathione S-transferase N-terminal domain-containing protein [unclassified Devosia]|uniref:glutathione S-transferase N-terminal domain-containing protein n=1 Tax=unclassified Devosia TaxID=196773 RepID=UPI0008684F53|nr:MULTISPECIES: glutathione S-transferase N-terminal domain-containing protein [unclassified Devosia]MBN9360077.1 glutathione S-transferase N-terminal domain-containing protein [Devosia sp.]ODS86711.1 MAG: glutathione S-transferase [Devosia sp. SCN 66-27]OJX22132.1 MAG: glutathione S-transferase [Devosia sp. 66-14]